MVIIDSKRGVKSANYIEMVGSYNPRQKSVDVKADRVKHWIAMGAKPTDTVHNILINQKVIEGKKVNPLGKKTPIIKEKAEEETKSEEAKTEPEGDASAEESKEESTPELEASAEEKPAEEAPAEEEKKEEPEPAKEEAVEDAKEETEDKKEEAA
jgi:small subunit ribosomal protein S16